MHQTQFTEEEIKENERMRRVEYGLMPYHDSNYLEMVKYILKNGKRKPNRTGVDTIGVFGYQMRFDLSDGSLPLLTTKKVHTKSIIHELLWMISGSSNIKYLNDSGVTIWDEWADGNGDLGPVYGVQWRFWRAYDFVPGHSEGFDWVPDAHKVRFIDQVATLIDKLKNNPLDRRLIVSAWNVAELSDMRLPPCHYSFQFYPAPLSQQERMLYASQRYDTNSILSSATQAQQDLDLILDGLDVPKYELSVLVNQRSCDVGLGVPFNIVQYSLLLHMFAEVANMAPGEMIWNGGDTHIYENHIEVLTEQTQRDPYPSPRFKFGRRIADIDDFKYDDFIIEGYTCHPAIKMEVAV